MNEEANKDLTNDGADNIPAEPQEPATGTELQQEPEPKPADPTFSKAELDKREASAKKAERDRLFKSLGVKDDAEYTALIDALKAQREAAAKNETDADKLTRLKADYDTLRSEHATALDTVAAMERRDVLRGYGVTDAQELKVLAAGIAALVEDGKDFDAAAAEYFADKKAKDEQAAKDAKKPTIAAGAGKSPLASGDKERLQALYDTAKKQNDGKQMVKLLAEAAAKKVTLT